jgi:hypothetical protein
MMFRRLFFTGLPLALAVAIGSCQTDDAITGVPTDAQVEPDAGLLGSLLGPTGLLSCDPLPPDADTATLGPLGGRLQIGPHVLYVPAGALTRRVRITGEIVPGNINAVHFTPQGLQFEQSARLTMSYENCRLLNRLLPKRIAYVDDGLNILEFVLSYDLLSLKKVRGRIDHFSSYAIAW